MRRDWFRLTWDSGAGVRISVVRPLMHATLTIRRLVRSVTRSVDWMAEAAEYQLAQWVGVSEIEA